MKFIDTHVHVFETLKGFNGKGEMTPIGGGLGRWATGEVCKMIPEGLGDTGFTYDTCYEFLKENGVEKAVLLQGNFYGFANEYVQKAVQAHPDMFIGAGIYDPFSIHADQLHDRLVNEFGFKILKFECSDGCGLTSVHGPFSIKEKFMPIAAKCAKTGTAIALDLGSPGMHSFQSEAVRAIADAFPEVKIVVCHLLAPTPGDDEALTEALKILNVDNVWFDLAAVPFNVQPEDFPYQTALKYIRYAKEIVGTEKLLWGTDIPSVLWYDTFEHLRDYIFEADFLTEQEKEDIFYNNALNAYPFER